MKLRGRWISKGKGMGEWPASPIKTTVYLVLEAVMGDNPRTLNWDRARQVLEERGYGSQIATDEAMTVLLHENGWEVLYTYQGA